MDFLKAGNDGLKETIEKADEIFERDGKISPQLETHASSNDCSGEPGFKIIGHDFGPCKTQGKEYDSRGCSVQYR